MKDLEGYQEQHPLNSRLVKKKDGKIVEEVYRVGGLYGKPLAAIVQHLEAAIPFATEPMAKALKALITFYRTGETKLIAKHTTSPGYRTKRRPSTRLTGSSRSTSTHVGPRALSRAWSSM